MFNTFYHGTFRKLIVAFGSLFDDINIKLDNNKRIRVPIHYAQKEKFIEVIGSRLDTKDPIKNISFPVMAYEIIALNYAPERNKNQMHKLRDCSVVNSNNFTYNRVPFDVIFDLYVAVKRLDDGFKIAEQILPNFSPSITLKLDDVKELGFDSNLIVDMTSTSFTVDYEDDFSDVRHIMWQFTFTVKTYLYRDIKQSEIINKVIVDALKNENDLFAKYTTLSDGITVTNEFGG